jgi:hypothetical protein
MWYGAPTPVKICCIKFVQRVILTQTASNGMEQKVGSSAGAVNTVANRNSPDWRS